MQLEVRGVNYQLDDGLKAHIERQLKNALGRFAARIQRLSLRMTDVNGPRGGVDKSCSIAVELIPRGQVLVKGAGDNPFALIADAAKRVRSAVRRELKRKGQHRPLQA